MRSGLNSHYFHIIGDGHQSNSRGLYTHYKDSLLKGGMTIPNIATFDHGAYGINFGFVWFLFVILFTDFLIGSTMGFLYNHNPPKPKKQLSDYTLPETSSSPLKMDGWKMKSP